MLGTPYFFGTSDYSHAVPASTGVLLVNIGTPDAATATAVRRYLREFLSDPRVIETPRWLWWPILHGVILRLRPARSARAYAKIWTPEGSPLRVYQQKLSEKLGEHLTTLHPGPIHVRMAMRYGQPAIGKVLQELRRKNNMQRLLVLPLYPQYSASATGSTFDAVTQVLQKWRWPPELRFINNYYHNSSYIEALARSVENYWCEKGRGERLLLSFHGIPERYFHAGDPYFCHCQATARLLTERLRLPSDQLIVSFQSRVGREPWLQPYTTTVLNDLARQGIRHLQVLCPGFAVDCLETLEEIAIMGRKQFLAAGGERFDYLPSLNDSSAHVETLAEVILQHSQGWPEFDTRIDPTAQTAVYANYERFREASH